MAVLLTRHGARIDKEDPRWLAKAGHGRADDAHLSASGRAAAAELAEAPRLRYQNDKERVAS